MDIRNDVKLTTPYRHHYFLEQLATGRQSPWAILMKMGKVFKAFITTDLCTVQEVADARSVTRCIVGTHPLSVHFYR